MYYLTGADCSRFPGNLSILIPGSTGIKNYGNPGRPGNGRPGIKASGNSRFEGQKFPPLSVKIPENSHYENTAYTSPV